ncbi:MAG: N-acyl homoserine lactonase family protein, partial [Verrucomicrobia bacterium]
RVELVAVRYGESTFRESAAIEGGDPDRRIPFAWAFWLIRSPDRVVLVDTGFENEELRRRWGIRGYEPPLRRLGRLDITPEQVTDIVLTHLHWDHAGCADRFHRARLWLQQREWEHARNSLGPDRPTARGMERRTLEALEQASAEGRLRLVDGRAEVAPGIELILLGGHTPGCQAVRVLTPEGPWVLASDNCYLRRNLEEDRPVGTAVEPDQARQALATLRRLAGSPSRIIPGHDPALFVQRPQTLPGIVRLWPPRADTADRESAR